MWKQKKGLCGGTRHQQWESGGWTMGGDGKESNYGHSGVIDNEEHSIMNPIMCMLTKTFNKKNIWICQLLQKSQ